MFSISNRRRYCFNRAFFNWSRSSLMKSSSRSSSVATTGRRPMNSGMRPNFSRSFGLDVTEDFRWYGDLPAPKPGAAKPIDVERLRAEMIFSRPEESSTADKQDVGRVDLKEFLLRMLPPTLRGNARDSAFHDLQQRLLHAFARDVAGDRRVVGFATDLIDLVDIDDAALRALDVVVGGLQQLQDDVFDVLADVAGLGQRRRIRHREWHVENLRQRLRQQRSCPSRFGPISRMLDFASSTSLCLVWWLSRL